MQLLHTVALLTAAIASIAEAATPASFYLKTQLKPTPVPNHPDYGDLYVVADHTGAGFNAAGLSKTKKEAVIAHIGSQDRLVCKLPGTTDPYAVDLIGPEDFYSGWASTQINVGTGGTRNFHVNKAGFVVNNATAAEFGGWRVCMWVHGYPELFHDIKGFEGIPLPCNCQRVNLVAEKA